MRKYIKPWRRFVGVYHRPTRRVHLFEREARASRARGGTRSATYALDDPALATLIEPDLWTQTRDEIELVEEVRARRAGIGSVRSSTK
jgi:peptide chain release factor 3